jgi:hypothetical protein
MLTIYLVKNSIDKNFSQLSVGSVAGRNRWKLGYSTNAGISINSKFKPSLHSPLFFRHSRLWLHVKNNHKCARFH